MAAVSHDLRTPITSLQLLTEAIGDDIVDGEQRRAYVDRMRTHIDALSALIDDLFELSRLEAGDITWSLHQVELDELVEETIEAMRVQADAKGVRVSATLPGDLVPARANPEKIQRVLFNLIQNAIRHTPADGSVVVRAEPSAGRRRDRGGGHGQRHRARRSRTGVHRLLSGWQRRGPLGRGRRPRAGGVARHRRGARRPHLAGGLGRGDPGPLQPAGHERVRPS